MQNAAKTWLALTLFGLLSLSLSCGAMWHDASRPVQDLLTLELMNYKLGTQVSDLSKGGQCPGTRPLKVVNVEEDTEKQIVFRNAGHKHYVIPKTFTDSIGRYVETKLVESGLKIDAGGETIQVSIEDANVEGQIVPEGTVSLKFEIPALNYAKVFTGVEGSASGYHTVAYAIHLAIDQFIKDPVFQKFAACR